MTITISKYAYFDLDTGKNDDYVSNLHYTSRQVHRDSEIVRGRGITAKK
jgi:hypothetical protein